tara:strand:+ start:4457 stop:5122 length:666 start_codon:yes stop_codon:yes gene_type:complete
MARQELNPLSGAANDRLGDTPNAYTAKLNAMTTELYDDTAANEAATVANALAIIATTALITGFTKTYWFDANDTATTSSPISHTAAATNTYLTNNAIGSSTTSYNPDSKDALWNPATNKFDFTSLKIGDTVFFRVDIDLTNAAAQEVDLFISLAEGSAAPYEKNMGHRYYKTASSLANDTEQFEIYIGDENTRTGGARFRFGSVDAATIVVNGWYYRITEV